MNTYKAAPEAMKAMTALGAYVNHASGLETTLLGLVQMRASMINGCAYCIDMHWKDAKVAGETDERLFGLGAWRETPFYTPRERAALEWTETLTLIAANHAPDEVFAHVREHFSEEEMVNLTIAIVAINGWNRIAIGFRALPGTYHPPSAANPA